MASIKEIVRLREGGSTYKEICAIARCSESTVSKTLKAVHDHELDYTKLAEMDDKTIRQLLFSPHERECEYYLPDWEQVDEKLKKRGVNMSLAWDEYTRACVQCNLRGYQYSQFCKLYNKWRLQHKRPTGLTWRIKHNAARLTEVDWAKSVFTDLAHYLYISVIGKLITMHYALPEHKSVSVSSLPITEAVL